MTDMSINEKDIEDFHNRIVSGIKRNMGFPSSASPQGGCSPHGGHPSQSTPHGAAVDTDSFKRFVNVLRAAHMDIDAVLCSLVSPLRLRKELAQKLRASNLPEHESQVLADMYNQVNADIRLVMGLD